LVELSVGQMPKRFPVLDALPAERRELASVDVEIGSLPRVLERRPFVAAVRHRDRVRPLSALDSFDEFRFGSAKEIAGLRHPFTPSATLVTNLSRPPGTKHPPLTALSIAARSKPGSHVIGAVSIAFLISS
jgi:hypothetical protein